MQAEIPIDQFYEIPIFKGLTKKDAQDTPFCDFAVLDDSKKYTPFPQNLEQTWLPLFMLSWGTGLCNIVFSLFFSSIHFFLKFMSHFHLWETQKIPWACIPAKYWGNKLKKVWWEACVCKKWPQTATAIVIATVTDIATVPQKFRQNPIRSCRQDAVPNT